MSQRPDCPHRQQLRVLRDPGPTSPPAPAAGGPLAALRSVLGRVGGVVRAGLATLEDTRDAIDEAGQVLEDAERRRKHREERP